MRCSKSYRSQQFEILSNCSPRISSDTSQKSLKKADQNKLKSIGQYKTQLPGSTKSEKDEYIALEEVSLDCSSILDFLTRWGLFVGNLLCQFIGAYVWLTQSAIEKETKIFYHSSMSSYEYRLLNEGYLYIYILTGAFGTYYCGKNLLVSTIIPPFCLTIGVIIIYMAGGNYWYSILGHFFASLAQAFMFPAPATIADRYFSKSQEPYILTIPIFVNMLGNGFALWFCAWLMDDAEEIEIINQRMEMIHFVGIAGGLLALLSIIPYLIRPPKVLKKNNGNVQTTFREIDDAIGFWDSTKLCFKDKMSFLNLIMGSMTISCWWAFMTISSSAMKSFGYSDSFVGLVGFSYFIFGAVMGLLVVKVFEVKLDIGLRLTYFIQITSWVAFFCLKFFWKEYDWTPEDEWFTYCIIFFYLLIGGSSMSIMGIFMNSCLVINYPISEAMSTGNIL